MSLVFMWPKAFKTQLTFMRKTGDSLKADPARKLLLSRKLKTLPENFPSQKLVQMPSVEKKKLISFFHWLLPFEIGVPTNSTRVNAAAQSMVRVLLWVSRHKTQVQPYLRLQDGQRMGWCYTSDLFCTLQGQQNINLGNPSSVLTPAHTAGLWDTSVFLRMGNTSQRWTWWCFLFLEYQGIFCQKSHYQQDFILNSTVLIQPHNALKQTAFPA